MLIGMRTYQMKKYRFVKLCDGGHDLVRESQAMWINESQWIAASYRCIVCGYFFEDPSESPTDPRPSRFHAE